MSATPCSRRIEAISSTARANRPASGCTEPRSPTIPERQLLSGNQGAWRRWFFAAEPKSHRIGSPVRVMSAYRAALSRAHSPMCVAVTYRMLFMSNNSSAPSSERSSASRTRPMR